MEILIAILGGIVIGALAAVFLVVPLVLRRIGIKSEPGPQPCVLDENCVLDDTVLNIHEDLTH